MRNCGPLAEDVNWTDEGAPKEGRTQGEVSKRQIVIFCLILAPLFSLSSVEVLGGLPAIRAYEAAQFVSMAAIVVMYIIRAKKDLFQALSLLLAAVVLISSIINGTSLESWLFDWFILTSMVLLVAWAREKYFCELIWGTLIVTTTISVLNFASVLMFPEGVYGIDFSPKGDNFLFGHRNLFFEFILPSVLCSLFLDAQRLKRCSIRSGLLIVLGYAQVVLAYSATQVFLYSIALLLGFTVQLKPARRVINGLTAILPSICMFVGVVVLRLQERFGFFIENVLHRSTTLSGRVYVWDKAFEVMTPDKWLWGYGSTGRILNTIANINIYHPHNEFLAFWISGGFLAVAPQLAIILITGYSLYRVRTSYFASIAAIVIFVYLVIGTVDIILNVSFPLVLAIAYYWARDECRRNLQS